MQSYIRSTGGNTSGSTLSLYLWEHTGTYSLALEWTAQIDENLFISIYLCEFIV